MKTRVLSALILAPLLLIIYFGGITLLVGCILISMVSLREFYKGFNKVNIKPSYFIGYLGILTLYAFSIFINEPKYYMLWFFAVVLGSLIYLFKDAEMKLEDAMSTLTGIIYIVYFLFHVVLIDKIPGYSQFVWVVLIIAFGTDTMAYFSGYLFGKHKLCPSISPKKTVEGAIGGTLSSIIFCGIFGYFFTDGLLVHCLVLGFIGSIFAQLGDLTASIFKRKMGIKDYGNLIPGHGGMLDRFDSVLFTAPVVYYYLNILILK
ncbi:MAG: phosphatidate cytidylyltransferase [Eubacteriales bacterium]